jgi:acyl carrier protein
MSTPGIQQQISDFIENNFLFGRTLDFDPDESLLARGIIDSTGVLELVGFIESQFGLTMGDEEVVPENLDSILNITNFVTHKLSVAAC